MEDLKTIVKACAAIFILGLFLTLGVRLAESAWPKDETKVRIVHYLCAENDDGDVSCGRIKDEDLKKKILD